MNINLDFNSGKADVDTRGAELKSLTLRSGHELMWEADPAFWGKTSPVLFPIVGTLKDNKTIIDGEAYELNRHGFARDKEFSYTKPASNSAIFTLKSDADTKKLYPFDFALQVKYSLLGGRMKINYSVENTDTRDMPFCLGAHPAIKLPLDKDVGGSFSDYKIYFDENESARPPRLTADGLFDGDVRTVLADGEYKELPLNYDLFKDDVVYLDEIKSHGLLISRDGQTGVRFDWTGFDTLGLWSPPGKQAPFLCVEPWKGSSDWLGDGNEFVKKRAVTILKPGETARFSITITEVL